MLLDNSEMINKSFRVVCLYFQRSADIHLHLLVIFSLTFLHPAPNEIFIFQASVKFHCFYLYEKQHVDLIKINFIYRHICILFSSCLPEILLQKIVIIAFPRSIIKYSVLTEHRIGHSVSMFFSILRPEKKEYGVAYLYQTKKIPDQRKIQICFPQ